MIVGFSLFDQNIQNDTFLSIINQVLCLCYIFVLLLLYEREHKWLTYIIKTIINLKKITKSPILVKKKFNNNITLLGK